MGFVNLRWSTSLKGRSSIRDADQKLGYCLKHRTSSITPRNNDDSYISKVCHIRRLLCGSAPLIILAKHNRTHMRVIIHGFHAAIIVVIPPHRQVHRVDRAPTEPRRTCHIQSHRCTLKLFPASYESYPTFRVNQAYTIIEYRLYSNVFPDGQLSKSRKATLRE